MKNAFLTIALMWASLASYAQLYKSTSAETSFFSETPVENISAVNKKGVFLINTDKGDLAISMRMKDFDFPNKLMQEHFNENYMESEKYPNATFKGKLNEKIDLSKDGTYDVSTTGDLTIHGVTKPRTLKGKLTKAGGKLSITCDFDVALSDHNIEVPKIVFVKIAQVIKVKNKYELAVK